MSETILLSLTADFHLVVIAIDYSDLSDFFLSSVSLDLSQESHLSDIHYYNIEITNKIYAGLYDQLI